MGLQRLTQNLRDMQERARTMRPVAREVHAELLSWQRTTRVDEDSGRLDDSLESAVHPDHIWEVRPKSFVFGTKVPYSEAHAIHRMRTGQQSHMRLPRATLERIAEKIGRYILRGDTF
jgi:hypothetical protein